MTTIKVTVEGKPLFVWNGDDGDLKKSEADRRCRFGKGDSDFPTFDDLACGRLPKAGASRPIMLKSK
jgi:hypothetical protein